MTYATINEILVIGFDKIFLNLSRKRLRVGLPTFFILPPEEFGFQKSSSLFEPVDGFDIDDRKFLVWNVIGVNPDIQQTLAYAASIAFLEIAPVFCVDLLFEFKKDWEEPGAIIIKDVLLHDEHVKSMRAAAMLEQIELSQIIWALLGDDFANFDEWLGVHGPAIVVVEIFDIIVAFFG